MKTLYPLFQSHIDLAYQYWEKIVIPGDQIIDATCGNGKDTLRLAKLALTETSGVVYACDLQSDAIASTQAYLKGHLSPHQFLRLQFKLGCHSVFPHVIEPKSVRLIVYNLGYLPGGNKSLTTKVETSLESIQQAQNLIMSGGLISVTCYPGHPEGAMETKAILDYIVTLDPNQWNCCQHSWPNRLNAPLLLLIQKALC